MAMHNKTLKLLASKIGLADEEKVLSKAAEFERLLQTKTIAGSNITDTSKAVICLDLASSILKTDLDIKIAVKYSGLKPSAYTNSRKTLENLLELNSDKLTTNKLCVMLQCGGAQDLADKILLEYQRQAKMEVDLNLPQYVCMAVYQACRINKMKVSKSKLIEKSRVKPSQWTKIDAEWTKLVDSKFSIAKSKKGRTKNFVEDEQIEKMEVDPVTIEISEPQVESYDDWKRRILKEAYRELRLSEQREQYQKELQHQGQQTPRRSPRKTPQKFTPYVSPLKNRGVRNLFTCD